jgi:selenocysteine lyase/cysteine desulfurase
MALIDEYAGNLERFPILREWIFLNHAGVSPLCAPVAGAMRQFIDAFESHGYLGGVGFEETAGLKRALAGLIGANEREIAILKNTAEGLSTVAFGLDW